MKLTDLIVSPKSLGDKLWLVDVSPAYEYKDGKRTDTVLGYRYSVALPEKGLDKVDVRIDGQQQTEAPNGYVEVRFDGRRWGADGEQIFFLKKNIPRRQRQRRPLP